MADFDEAGNAQRLARERAMMAADPNQLPKVQLQATQGGMPTLSVASSALMDPGLQIGAGSQISPSIPPQAILQFPSSRVDLGRTNLPEQSQLLNYSVPHIPERSAHFGGGGSGESSSSNSNHFQPISFPPKQGGEKNSFDKVAEGFVGLITTILGALFKVFWPWAKSRRF